MYDLYFNKQSRKWKIVIENGGGFSGSLSEVAAYCVHYLGIELAQIDKGLDDLIKNDRDVAHFGFTKNFLCSFESSRYKANIKERNLVHGIH